MVEQVRYQVTGVQRQHEAIQEEKAMAGWRAYGTNAPQTRLTLEQAVLQYRNEYRVERVFGRGTRRPTGHCAHVCQTR